MRKVLLFCAWSLVFAQDRQAEVLAEFRDFLAIPNVAADKPDIERNAEAVRKMMERRGIHVKFLRTPDAPPVVYGEIAVAGAKRTLIFYAHYDGQPVDAKQWAGGDPFRPVLRSAALEKDGRVLPWPRPGDKIDPEWRIYGRSSSDDKAPIIALMAALDRAKPTSNIKFFFEGEEEAASPHLEQIVRENAALLAGDAWLICDGPLSQNRQQQIYFGARGVAGLDVTVYGARRELHSGHYGNWAPNPAMMLARLLASMKDDDGRVLVDRFYDGIVALSESERKALAGSPDIDSELRRELWLARTEGSGRKLNELINEPSLNVRGLESVAVGKQARNVVPASATASIDLRLVKGIDWHVQAERVIRHIEKQGYFVTKDEPDESMRRQHPKIARVIVEAGYNAVRTSMDLPISRDVVKAVEGVRGSVVLMPTLGGSVPLWVFEGVMKTPMIGVPIVNHDNNQHSFNENLRLQNLWDGIGTMEALLTMR
jgi:acetylornithine deacetylase/succinyl-diaminopimelate desuccinylase-like protein